MSPQPPAPPADGPKAPTGAAAATAASEPLPSPRVQANALAYFMGEEEPPGKGATFPLNVDFGKKGAPNFQPCTFRVLATEELDKADMEANKAIAEGKAGNLVAGFVRWSFVFAYSCVEPPLGQVLAARKEREQDPEVLARLTDSAALVREVFRFQPGVLRDTSFVVEEKSRMSDEQGQTVREIEAGKTSS